MSLTAPAEAPPSTYTSPVRRRIGQYPLAAFFTLAYAGAWLAFLPLLLARNGLGILPLKLPLVPFLALATLTGPALSALLVSWATGGKSAIQQLLSRYTLWRFHPLWYLIILFLPPLAFLLGSTLSLGITPLQTLFQQAAPFVSTYPLLIIVGLITGPLGEELGWRGFALPRLQERIGPLWDSVGLGLLWAAWHLPLFLLPEWAGTANPALVALAFFSWVIPFSVVMAWIFNHTRQSLLTATLFHAAENATTGLIPLHILLVPNNLFLQGEIYGVLAVLLIAFTRGKLGYQPGRNAVSSPPPIAAAGSPASPSPASPVRRSPLRRVMIGLVVFSILAWGVANIVYVIMNGPK